MTIRVGDKIPSVELQEGAPDKRVNIGDLFVKKGILFGVPGAFTPNCSKSHLPGYVENFESLRAKGVEEIVCVSVNDAFVMEAWGKSHDADGKVRMLADPLAVFTKAIGMELDLTNKLGNVRSKRYAMIVEGGVVKHVCVEPDNIGLTCTLAGDVTKYL